MYNYTNGHIHINTEEYGVYTKEKIGTRRITCAEKVLSFLFFSVTIIGVIHKSKYALECINAIQAHWFRLMAQIITGFLA